jgi:hypothetical protein
MHKNQFVLLSLLALGMISCESESSFEERRVAAKALLSAKCDVVVDASSEFIKNKRPLIGAIVATLVSSKCDCITDSLAVQFANEYDLQAIKDMEHEPIESLAVILDKCMDKNDKVVMDCVKEW